MWILFIRSSNCHILEPFNLSSLHFWIIHIWNEIVKFSMFPFWCLVTNKTRLWQMYFSVFHQKRDLPLIPWQIMFDRNDLFSLPHWQETSRLIWRKAEFYTILANFTQETDFFEKLGKQITISCLFPLFCILFHFL